MHPNHPKAKADPVITHTYVCERVDCRVETVAIRLNTRERFLRTPLCPCCARPLHQPKKTA